jgi:hypothetical protein
MTDPNVHEWTRRWWEMLPDAYQEIDATQSPEVGFFPLLRFMDGPGRIAGENRDLSDLMWSGDFATPALVPEPSLKWLAQMLGTPKAQRDIAPDALRAYLLDVVANGQPATGSKQNIVDAAKRFLVGADRQAAVQPNILRTQWATNPVPSNANGWNYANAAYVKTFEAAVWGRPAMVFTRAAAGASASLWAGRNIGTLGTASAPPFDTPTLTPVVPGDVVTARLAVGTDKLDATGYLRISWLDSAGNKTTTPVSSQATAVAVAQNAWTDLAHAATAPAGAAFAEIETGVDLTTGVTVGGERVWAGRAYIGVNDPGGYYSGDTAPPAGMTLSWNGTAGASTSKMTTTAHTIVVLVRPDQVPPAGLASLEASIRSTGVIPAGHDLKAVLAEPTWDAYDAAVVTWDTADAMQTTWNRADSIGINL